jgi:hypothetical protein
MTTFSLVLDFVCWCLAVGELEIRFAHVLDVDFVACAWQ